MGSYACCPPKDAQGPDNIELPSPLEAKGYFLDGNESHCQGRITYNAIQKATGKLVAVTEVHRMDLDSPGSLMEAAALLKRIEHANIVGLLDAFDIVDFDMVFLVAPRCTGVPFLEQLRLDGAKYKEGQARLLAKQVFTAVSVLHEVGICHRDVRPEAFQFDTGGAVKDCTLKLVDFATCCSFEEGLALDSLPGGIMCSPFFMAPELLSAEKLVKGSSGTALQKNSELRYDQTCDMWSCGVILHQLVTGYPPFIGDTDATTRFKVTLGDFSFPKSEWEGVGEDLKTLVRMCLKLNPRDRLSFSQAQNWFTNSTVVQDAEALMCMCHKRNLRDRFSLSQALKHDWFANSANAPLPNFLTNLRKWHAIGACQQEADLAQVLGGSKIPRNGQSGEIDMLALIQQMPPPAV